MSSHLILQLVYLTLAKSLDDRMGTESLKELTSPPTVSKVSGKSIKTRTYLGTLSPRQQIKLTGSAEKGG